ncbi:MAG: DNA-directed RNA polymerase III subunit RPC8 isoform a [Piptocephalis tieghemiana]|nr:MAG: DNA-directed RNA polymerase III subunit RPC8 isoform a [Piptocephalis tieghemiana]
MFVLSLLSDRVRVAPQHFTKPTADAVKDELNQKFSNRVVQQVGLCICLFDIVKMSEGFIYHSDGCSYIEVQFRMVVFRPFVDEVLIGKIRQSHSDGIHVSITFFDDIFIPGSMLQDGTVFDAEEQVWIWKYGGNELFMDVGEPIRFRIVRESFKDASPTPAHRRRPSSSTPTSLPSAPTAPTEAGTGGVAGEEGGVGSFSNADKIAPYSLTVGATAL